MNREKHVKVLGILTKSIIDPSFPNSNRLVVSSTIRRAAYVIEEYAQVFQIESPIVTFSDWLRGIVQRLLNLASECTRFAYNDQGQVVALLLSDQLISERLTQILMELNNPPSGCSYME